MNWDKLKKHHYHAEPVEHVHSVNIFDTKEYDDLYDNQNNFDHPVWQDFDKKYKIGFEFIDDLTKINFNKEVMALWFFRERSDMNAPPQIDLSGKLIQYKANTFLLTKNKKFKIIEAKRKYIRRPVVQLDISNDQYEKIIERLK